jgi:hypothetical protein
MISSLSASVSHGSSSVNRVTHCRQEQGMQRDIRAPKHAFRTEGIVDLLHVRMDVAIGIGRARVARLHLWTPQGVPYDR